MRRAIQFIDTGTRAVAYTLGGVAIALAATVMATDIPLPDLASRTHEIVGSAFLALMGGLVLTAVFAWVQVLRLGGPEGRHGAWFEAGVQSANGVATLALTYTLLGISIGIGGLSEQELTPQTVQDVIRGLTASFSMAFMTTVVGLPLAAVLRTLLTVTHARVLQRPRGLPAPTP